MHSQHPGKTDDGLTLEDGCTGNDAWLEHRLGYLVFPSLHLPCLRVCLCLHRNLEILRAPAREYRFSLLDSLAMRNAHYCPVLCFVCCGLCSRRGYVKQRELALATILDLILMSHAGTLLRLPSWFVAHAQIAPRVFWGGGRAPSDGQLDPQRECRQLRAGG